MPGFAPGSGHAQATAPHAGVPRWIRAAMSHSVQHAERGRWQVDASRRSERGDLRAQRWSRDLRLSNAVTIAQYVRTFPCRWTGGPAAATGLGGGRRRGKILREVSARQFAQIQPAASAMWKAWLDQESAKPSDPGADARLLPATSASRTNNNRRRNLRRLRYETSVAVFEGDTHLSHTPGPNCASDRSNLAAAACVGLAGTDCWCSPGSGVGELSHDGVDVFHQ